MGKVLKFIGVVLGAVALIATGIGALGVGLGMTAAAAATATKIGLIAGIGAAVAGIGASLIKPKPPPARGSVTQILLDPNAPQAYAMGEGLLGGAIRHDAGYGATLNDVPNPYRLLVVDYSGGGPHEEITPYVDQAVVDAGYYSGFIYTDTQLGACPESAALVPNFSGAPGWDAASMLSGQAAIAWNLKFDKDGKKFASGVPQLGAYGKWAKVYDPRLDNSFPGGSGSHVLGTETTYTWSENPALHAALYAYGRYQNGKRTIGVGLPADAIDWANIAAWANVCDANAWSVFGVVYEPADRWQNLVDIAAAGGGVPLIAGGILAFHYAAPRIGLATITEADLAEGDISVTAMASWRERINTLVPKYRSAEHNWELVAAEAVSVSTFVTEDGEVKQQEWPFNMVKNVDQAAQLALYQIEDRRELQPLELSVGPQWRAVRPGECYDFVLPSLGFDGPGVVLRREFDPVQFAIKLTVVGETPGKHAFALGQTGTPPPTPFIGQTREQRDIVAAAAMEPPGLNREKISKSSTVPATGLLTATDAGSSVTVSLANHDRVYSDKTVAIAGVSALTGLAYSTTYYILYDDVARVGGAPFIATTTDPTVAAISDANPGRHGLGPITTPAALGANTTGGGIYDLSTIAWNIDWGSIYF